MKELFMTMFYDNQENLSARVEGSIPEELAHYLPLPNV
jgi:hypothetical protein